MRNPLRSEAEAFHFLLVVIAGFTAIIVASLAGGPWAGVPVFCVVSVLTIAFYFRGRPEVPPPRAPRRRVADDEHRILVVANETVAGVPLREAVQRAASTAHSQVLVVTPALNSPIRHWTSDEDGARAAAQQRLDRSLAQLRSAGVDANGEIGDADPLQAIEDSLRSFGADEIIISTHPQGRSNWLERGVVETARQRFAVPITHVVVDLSAEREPAATSES